MVNALIATIAIALILVLSEYLWRKAHIRGEFARKFVHILGGVFIAFLPYWNSYGWIVLLAIGFIAANLINRYTPLFHAVHAITRKSWGDLLFGVGILLTAALHPAPWIFTAAILQVALADGMAAIIGSHYGKIKYKLFDHTKSPVGTVTFYICSLLVVSVMAATGGIILHKTLIEIVVIIPLTLTIIENVSGYGTDNITLPLGFMALLMAIHVT